MDDFKVLQALNSMEFNTDKVSQLDISDSVKLHLISVYPDLITCINVDIKDAIKANPEVIRYIKTTDEEKILAVKRSGFAVTYIDNPSKEMCILALKSGVRLTGCIELTDPDIQKAAIETDIESIKHIKKYNETVFMNLKLNIRNTYYVENYTDEYKMKDFINRYLKFDNDFYRLMYVLNNIFIMTDLDDETIYDDIDYTNYANTIYNLKKVKSARK